MDSGHNGVPSRERRLDELATAYLQDVEAGREPDRQALLAGHPDLAAELAQFFDDQDAVGGLAAPGRTPSEEAASSLAPLELLGDFRIVREVGRGGMGVVYEAEQVSLKRRVALKVLPLAATLGGTQLQRFHNEARAAAGLHHTNIVPVYAVGCERGVHFYAMQYIDGLSLAAVLGRLRQPADPAAAPSPAEAPTTAHVPLPAAGEANGAASTQPAALLSTAGGARGRDYFRAVAELGLQAAEALDYGHRVGVVHRDVKPGNLLLDGTGRLWVTDFGLAQVQGAESLTATGELVGTLRYMSPEQALGKRVVIDHRTDVYSLGATLYELVTLQPACPGTDRQELLRHIAFEEPGAPRRLNREVPAELEVIVLKALEKAPPERYATAQELADDLRRWLDDRPIQARRPSLAQRLRKWSRRHRAAVTAGILCLLVTLVAVGGSAGWSVRDRVARQAAAEGEARALLQEARRLGKEEKLPEALNAARHAQGLLAAAGADPGLRRQAEQLGKDLAMVARLEEVRLEASSSSAGPGNNYAGEDRAYGQTFADYGLDMTTLNAAADRIRASAIRIHLLEALDDWGYVRDVLRGGAGDSLRAVARLADDDPWRQRLRDPHVRHDRAALERLARDEAALAQPPAVLRWLGFLLRQAGARGAEVRLLRAAQQRRPAEYYTNRELAGILKEDPATLADAIGFDRAALAIRPQDPSARKNLGNHLYARGELDEAIAEYREAIRLGDRAGLRTTLGDALREKGLPDEAIAEYREAIRLDADDAVAHNNLGGLLQEKGQLDAAIAEYRQAIRLKYTPAHNNLGNALAKEGKLDEAVAEYREAIRLKEDFPAAHCNLGLALLSKGEFRQAVEELRRGHELGLRNPSWSSPSAQWLRNAERLADLDARLPALLKGQEQLKGAGENLALAQLCQEYKQRFAAAARWYGEAFSAQPGLADDLSTGTRYNAACAAALAGCGQGQDAGKLDGKERARLRRQALDWLRADLEAWRRLLDKGPIQNRPAIAQQLAHWLEDTDFAGVRGEQALAKLPAAERGDWQKLWQEVEALRQWAARPPDQAAAPRP